MQTAVKIGAEVDAIKSASEVILAILNADADEATKVKALDTLHTICSVNGATISNCTFTDGGKK